MAANRGISGYLAATEGFRRNIADMENPCGILWSFRQRPGATRLWPGRGAVPPREDEQLVQVHRFGACTTCEEQTSCDRSSLELISAERKLPAGSWTAQDDWSGPPWFPLMPTKDFAPATARLCW